MHRQVNPNWGTPFLITAADPAAGAPFVNVNVANMHYRLGSVQIDFDADANAADRLLILQPLTSGAAVMANYPAPVVIVANASKTLIWSTASPGFAFDVENIIHCPLPVDFHFPEGNLWRIVALNIQVGDTITSILPLVYLFPETSNAPTLP